MAPISADRPAPSVPGLLSGLAVGMAVALTAGQPPAWAHLWLAAAVALWTVAVLFPSRSRLAFVAGLVLFLVWHIIAMRAGPPLRLIPYGHGSFYWG
jgi:uncharacterized membrane protein YhhN